MPGQPGPYDREPVHNPSPYDYNPSYEQDSGYGQGAQYGYDAQNGYEAQNDYDAQYGYDGQNGYGATYGNEPGYDYPDQYESSGRPIPGQRDSRRANTGGRGSSGGSGADRRGSSGGRSSSGGRGPARKPVRKKGKRTGTVALRWLLVLVVLVGVGAAARFVPGSPFATTAASRESGGDEATPTPSPTPPPLPQLRFHDAPITVTADPGGFLSWALLDRRTGEIWGSDTMTATTWPASMIKGWLSADFLRRLQEKGTPPTKAQLAIVDKAIRDSDNNAAQDLYVKNGGVASIQRLITMCKLTDTTTSTKGWSFTNISAQDTVRMADCIANGTAAGSNQTSWLLNEMATVRDGDWGIRDALPAAEKATVSIKNGWLDYTDDKMWHINCMAVTGTWAMAVLQRFPIGGVWSEQYAHGQQVCKDTATQLLNPAYKPPAG